MQNKNKLRIGLRGYRTVVVIFVLILLCSVATIGYFLSKEKVATMKSCGNPLKVTTAGLQNDIVIDCPANNAQVGRVFTITGTAHYQGSNYYQNVSVSMDGMGDGSYLTNAGTMKLGLDGVFHLPINLNGSKAVTNRLAVAGGYQTTYSSVPPGRHTFVVYISSGSKCNANSICDALIAEDSSAPLTLYVK